MTPVSKSVSEQTETDRGDKEWPSGKEDNTTNLKSACLKLRKAPVLGNSASLPFGLYGHCRGLMWGQGQERETLNTASLTEKNMQQDCQNIFSYTVDKSN